MTYSAWTLRRKARLSKGLCQDCGKRPKRNAISPVCKRCAAVRFEYSKNLNSERTSKGTCAACNKRSARKGKTLCAKCAELGVERARQRRKTIKEFLVSKLGGKCVDCGESDIRVLTIDHKNNDGVEHRRKLNTRAGAVFYQKLYREFRIQLLHKYLLQLLCFNCHAKKDLVSWWLK